MRCYACDAEATGQTLHNGKAVAACGRHANPEMAQLDTCIFCDCKLRKSAVYVGIDGLRTHAHAKCHAEAQRY